MSIRDNARQKYRVSTMGGIVGCLLKCSTAGTSPADGKMLLALLLFLFAVNVYLLVLSASVRSD